MRLLDLFCGRFGWGRAFAERGHEVVGIDLTRPPEIPEGCDFIRADVMQLRVSGQGRFSIFEHGDHGEELWTFKPDFICASSPCENFSIHGMKHFHPNPKYPELGVKLFNHTRAICEASGITYVMENVRAAQQFVGPSQGHAGSFHLWGNGVPVSLPRSTKGFRHKEMFGHARTSRPWASATIPPELANCVADYAEALIRQPNASSPHRSPEAP